MSPVLNSSSPRLISAAMVAAGIEETAGIVTAGTVAVATAFLGLGSGCVELPEFPASSDCCADPAATRDPLLISDVALAPTAASDSAACAGSVVPVAGTAATSSLACGAAALLGSPTTDSLSSNAC